LHALALCNGRRLTFSLHPVAAMLSYWGRNRPRDRAVLAPMAPTDRFWPLL